METNKEENFKVYRKQISEGKSIRISSTSNNAGGNEVIVEIIWKERQVLRFTVGADVENVAQCICQLVPGEIDSTMWGLSRKKVFSFLNTLVGGKKEEKENE